MYAKKEHKRGFDAVTWGQVPDKLQLAAKYLERSNVMKNQFHNSPIRDFQGYAKFWAVLSILVAACSINETKGPDSPNRNGIGPADSSGVAPAPDPKAPGPITRAATQECVAVRTDTPRADGQSGAVLKVIPRSGQSFAKVLVSDPSSVIYLRSEFSVIETGLYTVEVSNEEGLACWYALELAEDGDTVTLELGF